MKSTKWKYWRISRDDVDNVEAAKKAAPRGFTLCGRRGGQFVFRRPKGVPGARA